jgi:hypothetical protein
MQETHVRKGAYGWRACTSIPFPFGDRQLELTTMKRSNGTLATTACCGKQEGLCFTYIVFEDFNMRVLSENVRCTEAAVRAQHQKALEKLPEIEARCARHYGVEVTCA